MKILVSYRGAPRIRKWETGAMIADAFRRLGHEVDEYGHVYETQESVTSPTYHPDKHYNLILIMECNDGDRQYFELADIRADRKAVWFFDNSYYFYKSFVTMANFKPDHVFIGNYYLIPAIQSLLQFWEGSHRSILHGRKTSVSFLPYAADINKHFRTPGEVEKKYDVTLVGTSRPDREKLIADIRAEGLDAQLISGVFKEDYVEALASSRLVINQNPPEGRGLMNMRQFEAPAAGALLLTVQGDGVEQIKLPCMTYLPGQEAKAAKRLLPWSFDLETIRDAGHGYVLTYHTYDNRAKEILATLGV